MTTLQKKYPILNLTLQVSHNPTLVLQEMLRVAKKAIVSFPNFAHWKIRSQLFFTGLMPKSRTLSFEWYDTPNIRLVSIKDIRRYCKKLNIKILKEIPLLIDSREPGFFPKFLANILAEEGLFVLSR